MPQPFWQHVCCNSEYSDGQAVCEDCGTPGTFEGWGLRMHEAMARYQYLYGLIPIGPHRPLADQLFEGTRSRCDACRGTGLESRDPATWWGCRACEGTGGFWTIAEAEVEAIRQQVLAAHPQATAPREIRFLTAPLAQEMSTGRMVDLTRHVREGA